MAIRCFLVEGTLVEMNPAGLIYELLLSTLCVLLDNSVR